jgi:polyisoprenyl-phosphate glycosyltransferase
MRYDIFVSVVVPLSDDGDILPAAIEEMQTVLKNNYRNYELIFVDDGSCDQTPTLFEKHRNTVKYLRYIRLSRRFGLEVAIECGLDHAIGDVIVVLRPECDPPELIPDFVTRAKSNGGIVIGTANLFENASKFYRFAYNGYYALCKSLLDRPQIYCSTHFIALTRTALNGLLKIKDSHRYLRVLSMDTGYKVDKLTYKRIQRREPERQREPFGLVRDCVSMIVSNSLRPLRYAGAIAGVSSLVNMGYLGYVLFMRIFISGIQPGWAAIAFQNSAMFAVLFLVAAVMCEYMARVLGEVKNRPLYYIAFEKQSSVMVNDTNVLNVVYDEDKVQPGDSGSSITVSPTRAAASS